MSKFLFGILASVAFVGGAMAADLPRKEPPPVAAHRLRHPYIRV